ncbi:MAG: UDP-N-acetylmuramoyl-L-alanyl-D-glutamate--2,6-diaminopimelate ligase, partial [Clostridia bacterium]|nr:UDP-N-acetylmuramoyl-L-alanyl-D-glutamate--2,6-diaminopimelate ligase [Clostridia bacterium]
LFGCGGNRDKKKRKIMGAISEKYADYSYITNDNPRYEDPLEIIADIVSGFNSKRYYTIEDRKMALNIAINSLVYGDTLLVCGKGCEDYIEINGTKIPYNDTDTVKQIIEGIR